MRLALAQINPTVGDIAGNARRIAHAIDSARAQHADLVVLPELCICGYPPKDLLLQEGFVDACLAAASELGSRCSADLTLVLGTPTWANPSAPGTGISNSLLAFRDGALIARYDKRLLPTYDVFDENRYFIPGSLPVVIDVPTASARTWRVGLSVCEDLWRGEDVGFGHRYFQQGDPVTELCARQPDGRPGAQLIVNPSASPFVLGKNQRHRDLLSAHAKKHRVLVAAVNQVGGNDELVFDGHACVLGTRGQVLAAGPGFEDCVLVVELDHRDPAAVSPRPDPLLSASDPELLYRALVLGVRDYLRKTGFKSAVLGLSGGIDSAVVAVLAAGAIGPGNVLGVSLPSRYSSQGSKDDAQALAHALCMGFTTLAIENTFISALDTLAPAFAGRAEDVSEENLQSRIRGTLLMALSNKLGHILLTTGNKSELAVGYCTLYGDMNGGLAVLSDVTKQWVYTLARWINTHPPKLGITLPSGQPLRVPPIPEASITKPPSAELRPNQTDQDSLPPYEVLDEIIERYVERRQSPARIVREAGLESALVQRIVRLIDLSEYKRKQAAIGLKVTGVAFGSGRRYPIAQGYRPGV